MRGWGIVQDKMYFYTDTRGVSQAAVVQLNGIMTVTRAQIQEHNNRQSCWIAIRGDVYDVTGLLSSIGQIRTELTTSRLSG